jgi:uncharacterized protein (TIGR03118 family)
MDQNLRALWRRLTCTLLLIAVAAVGPWGCGDDDNGNGGAPSAAAVRQTNLVSDVAGTAPTTDSHLVNAWAIARSTSGPFWVANNHSGTSTLYNGGGQPFPVGQPLVVTVPPPGGSAAGTSAAPTGMVFNATTDFMVTKGGKSGASAFIFATEDGTLSGWNQTVDAGAAILTADNSATGAIYKGLALANNGSANFLYATDFHRGRVDVFDNSFAPAHLSGAFTDASIPAGFAPFGIATINGNVWVTYAKQDEAQEDDVKAPGNGYVNIFNPNGGLVRRFASQGALNSPWGMVLAPAGFGNDGGAVLIGNFGDGHITAFDPSNGTARGQLTDGHDPIAIDGLWGLEFGNGASAGDANTLFFAAGPADEDHGLFGMLQPM